MYPVILGLFLSCCFLLPAGKANPVIPTGREGRDTPNRATTDTLLTTDTLPEHIPDTSLSFTYQNVRDYIFRRIYYPPEAKKKDIQGTVIVGFRLTESGKIDQLRIIRRVHPLLDSAALNLIKEMPQWRPVYVRGEPTAFDYEVPVIFELLEEKP